MTPVRLEPANPWSQVKRSTTEPLRSHNMLGLFLSKTFSFFCERQIFMCVTFFILNFCLTNPIQLKQYSKTCLKWPLKKMTKIGFQDRLSLNAGQKYCRMLQEHSAILLTCIKLPFVFKIFVWSIFEWPLKTGFAIITIPGTLVYHCDSLLPHPLYPARHVINPTNKKLLKLIHQEWTLIRYFWPHLKNKTTVKPVLSSHSKTVKTKILKTHGSLIKVESIAECSLGKV